MNILYLCAIIRYERNKKGEFLFFVIKSQQKITLKNMSVMKGNNNMKEFIINQNDADQRVDKFILKAFPKLSKSVMYKAIRTKNIKLNGKRCEISTYLSQGDVLRIFINDEYLGSEKKTKNIKNDFMSASDISENDIVYEDENIILINKKIGVVIHSDINISENTLIDQIKKYLYLKHEYIPENESSFAPSVCNRLDRNTSGIVIAAKNAHALREINEKNKSGEISKKYLCLSASAPPKQSDTAYAYHKKDASTNTVTISATPQDGYKQIITKYDVIKKNSSVTLIEIELITGRTHQIRAHMAFLGCPIIGDIKYGDKEVNQKHHLKYQALCAYKLKFNISANSESMLSYLDGKEFKIDDVCFLKKYF